MKTFVVFILTVSVVISCRNSEVSNQPVKAIPVKTIRVEKERMVFPVRASGIVVPAKEIKLSFKTGGIVKSIYAEEGSRVKKGDLLAILNMAEIDGQVTQARNGYEKAERDFRRAQNLFKDSVITLEQFQNAETAYNVASATLEIAKFNSLHSRIIAPEDGVILKRLVESHEMVSPGYPVFVFGTSGLHWKIKTGLADRDYVRVSAGDSAKVTFDVYPGETFDAVVSQITEAANPTTGTYEIELDVEPVKRKLAAGFIANIEIIPSKAESYFNIPVEAFVEAEGTSGYIFIIQDSAEAKRQEVKISGVYESRAAVVSGLSGGEIIATEGAAYLSDGDKIEIVK